MADVADVRRPKCSIERGDEVIVAGASGPAAKVSPAWIDVHSERVEESAERTRACCDRLGRVSDEANGRARLSRLSRP